MAEQDFGDIDMDQLRNETSKGGKLDNLDDPDESDDAADGADEPVEAAEASGGVEDTEDENVAQEPQESVDGDEGNESDEDLPLEDAILAGYHEVDAEDGAANPRVTNYDPGMSALLWAVIESDAGAPYRDELLDAIEDRSGVRPATQSGVAKQLQRIGLAVVAPEYFEATQQAKLRSEGGF